MTERMDKRFADLAAEGRPALVTYFMGGDPDYDTSLAIMRALPEAWCRRHRAGHAVFPIRWPTDRPFRRPGCGRSGACQTLAKTLQMARDFRAGDSDTPIVMMGYYNPIYIYGVERFLDDAVRGRHRRPDHRRPAAGDGRRALPAGSETRHQLHTPGDADHRRQAAAGGAHKHVRLRLLRVDDRDYRAALPDTDKIGAAVGRIKGHTELPVCVGFGVKTEEHARIIGGSADGVVVGTAIVNAVAGSLSDDGKATGGTVEAVATLVRSLASGVRAARLAAAE